MSSTAIDGKRLTVSLKNLVTSLNAARDRDRMFARLKRVYGVPRKSVEACLALPKEKWLDPSKLTLDELVRLFGSDMDCVNSNEAQLQLLGDDNGNGNGNGNQSSGTPPVTNPVNPTTPTTPTNPSTGPGSGGLSPG